MGPRIVARERTVTDVMMETVAVGWVQGAICISYQTSDLSEPVVVPVQDFEAFCEKVTNGEVRAVLLQILPHLKNYTARAVDYYNKDVALSKLREQSGGTKTQLEYISNPFEESNMNPYPTKNKGASMATFSVLGHLAQNDTAAIEDMGLKGTAGAALRAAIEKQKAVNEQALGTALLSILQKQTTKKDALRQDIRAARRAEQAAKDSLNAIDRAFQYAQETSNYVPWASLFGIGYSALGLSASEFNRLKVIPADWKPTETDA